MPRTSNQRIGYFRSTSVIIERIERYDIVVNNSTRKCDNRYSQLFKRLIVRSDILFIRLTLFDRSEQMAIILLQLSIQELRFVLFLSYILVSNKA